MDLGFYIRDNELFGMGGHGFGRILRSERSLDNLPGRTETTSGKAIEPPLFICGKGDEVE